ncbi:MAG TPA: UDP-N-acetylglucosamine 1-carboxyvinyltransferase [Candidatus Paceibacterota bacterium]|nr:UDP-N-acetylglucosamine 1-carboxyvinyltransferase [Candidatus Paceibacterota bacterium]HMO83096.1 UDP-N-acetylglucosamine 1-carboxyvinyltransferase [Candidatus Paceibacterota bacterium]
MKNIGQRITEVREARGITQTALAKKLKTTQSAVARIESGRQNVSTDTLSKIGQALGQNIISLSPGSINIQIDGGHKLSGIIETNTSKNGAVGLLCASLLNRQTTTLHHMPRIEEVHRIIEVLESIGVKVEWDNTTIKITPPKKFDLKKINIEAAKKTRSIVMFIGPLIHLLEKFSLPQSGGCKLGSRTVRPHFYALENFGVNIETTSDSYQVTKVPAKPSEIILYESGDTVTENALFAAAKTTSTTVIKYASANYMVQEICIFLQKLGVKIEGVGTTTLTVTGVADINTPIEYTLAEDPTDSMFFIASAIITKSNLTITRCPIEFLELELLVLEKMGLEYTKSKTYFSHNGITKLVDLKIKASKLTASPDKIHPRPYPGLNADNLPFFAVIATQADGQTLIHDWMYEKRAIYFTELEKLGADAALADPHRIFITGPTKLKAAELICPPALRPATILLVAMLGAQGHSVLRNIYSIKRGYENLVERLTSIGAKLSYLDVI